MNIIGLDISKDTFDVFLHKSKPTDGRQYEKFENSLSGCIQLQSWIKQQKIRKLIVAMEATGIYYKTAADYLSNYYDVYVINPLKIKKYAEAHFVRTKTDKADAQLIADYTRRHLDKLHSYTTTEAENETLNNLITLHRQLKEQIGQNTNRLHLAQDDYARAVLKELLTLLKDKAEQTEQHIDGLLQRSSYKEQYACLQTIAGISNKTAAVLVQHLSSRQFANANQFIAFAGLSPQIRQSGVSVNGKGRLTRYGHRRLKTALYMPAVSAYRSKAFRHFVERLAKQGKPKMVIIGALMRKLAKIAYYIYKTPKPFEPDRHLI